MNKHPAKIVILSHPSLLLSQAQHRDSFMWERYSLSDPFLALQRDSEVLQISARGRGDGGSSSQRRQGICGAAARSDPLAVLKLVVGHCRRMQEKMLKQLAAAESRHRRVSISKQTFTFQNKCLI